MCPYYSREYKICKIYKTLYREGEYHTDAYCMEMRYDHTQCPNYKECMKSNNGIIPPPYKF